MSSNEWGCDNSCSDDNNDHKSCKWYILSIQRDGNVSVSSHTLTVSAKITQKHTHACYNYNDYTEMKEILNVSLWFIQRDAHWNALVLAKVSSYNGSNWWKWAIIFRAALKMSKSWTEVFLPRINIKSDCIKNNYFQYCPILLNIYMLINEPI